MITLRKNINIFFVWVFIIFLPYNLAAESNTKGLYFNSHKEIKDKHTGLDLFPEGEISLPRGFNLEFDLNIRNENSIFGYICRVIANDTLNIDVLSGNSSGSDVFWLVCGNDKKQFFFDDNTVFKKGEWMHAKLSYFPVKKLIELTINGVSQKITLANATPSYSKFSFYFGVNKHERFYTTDVAPILLSEVSISDLNNKMLYHWTLQKHGENFVYDSISHLKAKVINPLWQIDSSIHWEHFDSLTILDKPLITFNELKSELYVVGQTSMQVVHLNNSKNDDTISFIKGKPYNSLANQIIYNPYTNELWSYDFDNKNISKYNFTSKSWSLRENVSREPSNWHHNVLISPVDSSLICFGGYGYHTYNNNIWKYDPKSSNWMKHLLSKELEPRYLSASTLYGNKMLIFGGFGSRTGEQQLSPHAFCDLFAISLVDFTTTRLWSMKIPYNKVQARSLIMDKNGQDLYTLSYSGGNFKTWLQLYKLNKNKEGFIPLADSIPYQFSDTGSYCDLFFVSESRVFVVVTVNHTSENKYAVNLYRLNYPAIPLNEVLQLEQDSKSGFAKIKIIGFTFIFLLIVTVIVLWFLRQRKMNRKRLSQSDFPSQNKDSDLPIEEFQKIVIKKQMKPSSITLLGGFQAINRKGIDITAMFTPTLKNLLFLILLNSYKNGKGISSLMLEEILWYDKLETTAKNNRNVNINKLRSILEEFEGIHIVHDNTYWKTELTQPFFCDYIILMDFAQQFTEQNKVLYNNDIAMILSLSSQGLMLPNTQTEWVDPFKAEFSTKLIDLLQALAIQADNLKNYKLLLQIAETLLILDAIDEDALYYKCKSLTLLGKKSAALAFYNNFCKKYKVILNDDFQGTFEKLLEK